MRCHQSADTHNQRWGEALSHLNGFWKTVTYMLLKLCFLAQPNTEEIKVHVGSDRNENNRLQGFHFPFLKKLTQGGRRVKGKRKTVPKYHLSSEGCQRVIQRSQHSWPVQSRELFTTSGLKLATVGIQNILFL